MQGITLTIAAIASVLVFLLTPIYGLIVYLIALAYYPSYITVKVGTLDFSVTRIVIIAIYANLFLRSDLIKHFRLSRLDWLMIIYFVGQYFAGMLTSYPPKILENRSGEAFDALLPYFAVRMIIRNKGDYLALLKSALVIAAPLAIVGLYQCITGDNPAGFFRKYYAWGPGTVYSPFARSGFFRANVTFSHPIMLGLLFATFGPICAGILPIAGKYRILCWLGLLLMGVGVFSSMSSGPVLAALVATAFIAFYRFRRYWKMAVAAIVFMCLSVEIISNRHFYYYPTRFTFDAGTAWYRGRLIDVALFEGGMSGNWLIGYGIGTNAATVASVDWGQKIPGWGPVDLVNHYLLILFNFGLMGLIPFLAIIATTIQKLRQAFRSALLDQDKWLIWCLAASLVGLLFAFFSVSLHAGQSTTFFFILLGLCGAMPLIVANRNSELIKIANSKFLRNMKVCAGNI
jgi:hypothetical protein